MWVYSFLNFGASWGWTLNVNPRRLYPRERHRAHWMAGPVGTVVENLVPTGV